MDVQSFFFCSITESTILKYCLEALDYMITFQGFFHPQTENLEPSAAQLKK